MSQEHDMYKKLKDHSIEVYYPMQKVGECISNYVVTTKGPSTPMAKYTTKIDYYEALCYVKQYEYITDFVESIAIILKELYPMIQRTYNDPQPYWDDGVKAWMCTIQYKNHKKEML